MAKVPYEINVDRYVCTELEYIRKMIKTMDFSTLPAVVERIQYHVSSMEEALYRYEGIKYDLKTKVDKEDISDKDFRKEAKKVIKKLDK